jgi:subtilisin family serine protease
MTGAYKEKEKPLLDILERQGYKAEYASSSSPVVFATLPKHIIVALASNEDVGRIYLLKGELHNRLNTVVPTDRIPVFWNADYTGNGVKVAIVEADPVLFGNPYLSHANGGTCDPFPWESDDGAWHPTSVAGILALDGHDIFRGVTPDVTLISGDAGTFYPQSRIATAGRRSESSRR